MWKSYRAITKIWSVVPILSSIKNWIDSENPSMKSMSYTLEIWSHDNDFIWAWILTDLLGDTKCER